MITYNDFLKVDIRVGTIIDAQEFPEARNPAYKLSIDFGNEIGIKKSSAQITKNYTTQQLLGKQIIAVVNFPPKQVGPFISEVLVLGLTDAHGAIILVSPEAVIENGQKLH